jgi:hypothetical protein
MDIEQLFRDGKNKRHGWSLRDTGIDRPDRLDRLILVLALAYLLLMGVGLIATERYDPSHWSSNRRSDSASLFTIGQWMLDTIGLRGLTPPFNANSPSRSRSGDRSGHFFLDRAGIMCHLQPIHSDG